MGTDCITLFDAVPVDGSPLFDDRGWGLRRSALAMVDGRATLAHTITASKALIGRLERANEQMVSNSMRILCYYNRGRTRSRNY
jgi:hypothetical protein